MSIPLSLDALDTTLQVRAAINEGVVAEYANWMRAGAVFPPITVFDDGVTKRVSDGQHRCRAAALSGLTTIEADVRVGSEADALWAAVIANRTHGLRFGEADKKRAVFLLAAKFPELSSSAIASHLGCNQAYVTRIRPAAPHQAKPGDPIARVVGTDGRSYPASREAALQQRELAAQLLLEGKSIREVRETVGIGRETLAQMRRELRLPDRHDTTRKAIDARVEKVRTLAADGYTSRQIAGLVQLHFRSVREIARRHAIAVPADAAVGKTVRHNSTRIVSRIVEDAENLTECVNLVDFRELDRAQVAEWLRSLMHSRAKLHAFIKRLQQESSHEAA